MTFVTAFWHVVNFAAVPLALGAVAAWLAKIAWRRELAGVGWWPLAWPAGAAALAAAIGGLVVTGRDGRIATYAAMVLACATALLWRGVGRRRGR